VDLFQAGQLDVIVCSFGVGSTGLTLTKSSRLILLDRPWTPGDAKQAEDRIRRIGQHASEVQSFWIAGFSFDDSLDKLLQKKDRNTLRVIEVQDGEMVLKGSRTTCSWFSDGGGVSGSRSCSRGQQQHDLRDYFGSCGVKCGRGSDVADNRHPGFSRPWWECSAGEGEVDTEPLSGPGGKENHESGEEPHMNVMRTVLRELLL
jgi:hypothetical protein